MERGLDGADGTTEHYTRMGVRHLFVAALEAQPGYVAAANLWNASDELDRADTERARGNLLRACSAAGFADRADLGVLRSYACALNSELIEERPHLTSFGPKSTRQVSGDHRRTDALFVDLARFVLSMKEDRQWLDGGTPGTELDLGTDDSYRGALQDIAAHCAGS